MQVSPELAAVILTIITALSAGGIGLIRLGIAIKAAERRAKHEAIDAMNAPIGGIQLELRETVRRDLFDAYRAETDRRIETLERHLDRIEAPHR